MDHERVIRAVLVRINGCVVFRSNKPQIIIVVGMGRKEGGKGICVVSAMEVRVTIVVVVMGSEVICVVIYDASQGCHRRDCDEHRDYRYDEPIGIHKLDEGGSRKAAPFILPPACRGGIFRNSSSKSASMD